MISTSQKLVTISIAAALAITVAAFLALTRIRSGIVASAEHKSAKHTTATVVSVMEVSKPNTTQSANRGQLYKVCFTIDNFDEVDSGMRYGYQSAETQRLTKDGPRCKLTSKVTLADSIRKGSKLSVVYLLENDYRIDLAAISACGETL